MQGMGHEAGLRIPSSRAGMPLVGAGRLQLAGWWAWGLKATITHKVRYNTPAPRAHTTGIPAPELRCRSKWHGRPNPLPGAVRAAWCPCPYACMPRPMPPMPVPWLRPCAVCIYTGEHPRGGGLCGCWHCGSPSYFGVRGFCLYASGDLRFLAGHCAWCLYGP